MNKRQIKKQSRRLIKQLKVMSFSEGEVLAVQFNKPMPAEVAKTFLGRLHDTVKVPVVALPHDAKVFKVRKEDIIND